MTKLATPKAGTKAGTTLGRRVLIGIVLWFALFAAALTPVALTLTVFALALPELGDWPTAIAMTACVTSFVHFEIRKRL